MHGAGLVHGMFMAPADVCGGPSGIIEMLPMDNPERGIEHLVQYLGHRYWRWQGNVPGGGPTEVDTVAVGGLMREAIEHVLEGRRRLGACGAETFATGAA